MNRSIAFATVAFAAFAGPAFAGVIGPTRPTQAIVLRVSGNGTTCLPQGGGQDVDLQVNPDGTIVPYAPPAGQGFVITGIDWGASGATASQYIPIVIRVTNTHAPSALVFATGSMSDAAGKSWGSAAVPDVAVAPGSTMCVGLGAGTTTQLVVHGFHTAYK